MLPCPLGRSWASFFFGQGTQSRHPQMGLSPNECRSFGELLLYFCSLHLVDGQSEGGNPQSRSNICGSITTLLVARTAKRRKKVPNSNAFRLRPQDHPWGGRHTQQKQRRRWRWWFKCSKTNSISTWKSAHWLCSKKKKKKRENKTVSFSVVSFLPCKPRRRTRGRET